MIVYAIVFGIGFLLGLSTQVITLRAWGHSLDRIEDGIDH